MIHPTAEVSPQAEVGEGTRIWHQAQVRERARIGRDCIISKGVYILASRASSAVAAVSWSWDKSPPMRLRCVARSVRSPIPFHERWLMSQQVNK